jgi:hypothetical protein
MFMNFSSLYNKLQIIEEAKAGRFEKLFQTGYLKKAIEDKKIGVARPIVFEFIINFLKEKGMVPEGTAFQGSRYAAEAGDFIKNLVDTGLVKDEIADEFGTYVKENLGQFLQRKQQVRSRGKGENIGKTFGSAEEFNAFKNVKTKEEMDAEKQAAKEKKQAAADDIAITSPIDAKSAIIEVVSDSEIPLDMEKLNKFFTSVSKGKEFTTDQGAPNAVDFEFAEDSPVTMIVNKLGANKVESSIKSSLAKTLGLDASEFEVVVHAPGYFEFAAAENKPKTKAQRTGADLQGYGLGTIAQDDSERRLANPFEDEEVLVQNENHKPKVTFISTKDRFKPTNSWQQAARAEMFYK